MPDGASFRRRAVIPIPRTHGAARDCVNARVSRMHDAEGFTLHA